CIPLYSTLICGYAFWNASRASRAAGMAGPAMAILPSGLAAATVLSHSARQSLPDAELAGAARCAARAAGGAARAAAGGRDPAGAHAVSSKPTASAATRPAEPRDSAREVAPRCPFTRPSLSCIDALAGQEPQDDLVVLLGALPLRPVGGVGHAIELSAWGQRRDVLPDVGASARIVVGPQHQRWGLDRL